MNRIYCKTVPLLGTVTSKCYPLINQNRNLCLIVRGRFSSFHFINKLQQSPRVLVANDSYCAKAYLHSSTKDKDSTVTAKSGSGPLSRKSSVEAWDVDFNNVEDAYKIKSTSELLRALSVFYLCNIQFLVTNGVKVG